MNIVEFYLDLAARDIALWTEDDKLRFRAPKGAMTQQIVAKIKANRPKIIAWLQNRAATTIPLSQAQRALWYVHQSAPSSPAYNLAFTLQLTANLDVAALEQAWQILLERHAVLRTTYVLEDEVPVGKIGVGTADFKQIDTAAWGTDQIEQWIAAEADRPFDLANGSVCRTHLLAGSVNHFVVVIHHIAVDFVAVQHLLSELETVYAALIAGQDVTLPPLDVTFHDYVRWEESKLSAENTNLTDYWQQKLAGELPTVNLTTDAPRPPVQTYNGAMCEFDLDAGLSQALRTLSQTNGVTPYMTLLAAFQVLLQRYTEQDDILIGSPMDIRGLAAFREVVGYYVNSVVLRADLADDPTFADLLKRVQQTALGAFKHQLHPFAQLVKQLQVQRDPSRSPLFQVSFVWDRFAAGTTEQGGLIEQVLTAGQRGASDDLAVTFYDKGISAERTFSGNLTYNTDLFDTATIERMAQQLQTLLASIVANPKLRVSELALLTETERQQILVEWNDTATDYPTDSCYHDLFAAQVERTPDEVAVVTHDGKQLTYRQLNEKANQVAHYLIKLGVTADAPVGIAIERSLEMVIGVLGILKAGGAYLPLDPNYPPERLQFMVQDARPTVLLTKTTQRAMVEKLTGTEMTVVQLDAEWEHIAQELRTNPTTAVAADNLSYIIYTSGSTGQPKGVMVSHRNQVNHNLAIVDIYGVTASDRVLQFATLNFDSAVEEIFPTLLVGGTLVLRDAASIITVADLHALTEREGITTYNFPTAYWHEWVSELTRTGGSVPSSLRLVAIGGEKALESRLEQWLTLVGNRVTLQNTYGPTEATVIASAFLATDSAENRRNFPIGKPIANTQLYILDAAMQPVPIGVAGELHIGGRGVARGYLNRSVLTAERFVRDPFSDDPAARLYRTGDRVRYRADGNIEFVGRTDNQIKLRGFRVELGEIEAALTAHAAVENAVVLLDEQQSNKRLIAYVAATIEASEVRTWLQSRLPSYMVPSGFVMLPALPRLPNGKINRKALVGMTEDVAVEKEASAEFEPQNETEAALVAVWSQVLNLDESDIGVHDNFFELGGDSILSIQIVSRALEVGVTVTPEQVFQNQTIAELATVANQTAHQIAEQGLVTGRVPLTPIQKWFFKENYPNSHHYNQSLIFRVQVDVSAEILQQAVEALQSHHDALRLRYINQRSTKWEQVNAPLTHVIPFEEIDLTTLPADAREEAVGATVRAQQAQLNITDGPGVRVVLFRVADDDVRLLIILHHLMSDGFSWRILLEDLETAYRQLEQGADLQLPAKTTAFKEWAERLEADGLQVVADENAYWLGLTDAQPADLPVDLTDGANDFESAETVSMWLSADQTRELLQDVPTEYHVQIKDILLTALLQLFSDWTDSDELLLNMEGHGREQLFENVDLSRTIGWLTSLYPMRLTLDESSVDNAIKSVKEQVRQVPRNGVGYGILRHLAAPKKRRGNNRRRKRQATITDIATPNVSFNYLGQFQYGSGDGLLQGVTDNQPLDSQQDPQTPRNYLLEFDCIIKGGQLQMLWTYSRNRHKRETVEWLAEEYTARIDELIEHCLSAEESGYTPSDFAAARVNQAQLDKLMAKLKK